MISSKNFQHTPGTYPRPRTNSLWRNSFHLGVWGGLGYAPGVCWGSLRYLQSFPIVVNFADAQPFAPTQTNLPGHGFLKTFIVVVEMEMDGGYMLVSLKCIHSHFQHPNKGPKVGVWSLFDPNEKIDMVSWAKGVNQLNLICSFSNTIH